MITLSEAMMQQTGCSPRQLCRGLALPYTTFQRWRKRLRHGEPPVKTPGPKKTAPLPLAQLREVIQSLPHRTHRTGHTTALYQQYQSTISRRELAGWVQAERRRRNRERQFRWQRITWHQPNLAWATDATEYLPDQQGNKLLLVGLQDLASSYRFTPIIHLQLSGALVAQHLAQLFKQHGAPLILKRDNGSIFNDHAVDAVLAEHGVIPLNSPRACPRYNGAIEKGLREMKDQLTPCLPQPSRWQPDQLNPLILAVNHLENAKPRRRLQHQSAATTYYQRPRLRLTRRLRQLTFEWINTHANDTLQDMETRNQQGFQRAWRAATLTWLRRQGLITVSQPQKPNTNQQILLPLF